MIFVQISRSRAPGETEIVKPAVQTVAIQAVLAGRPAPLGDARRALASAIGKLPLDGPVRIGPNGLDVDEQADTRHHGGPEKAVHHYAFDHYAAWREELAPTKPPCLDRAGAFGENLSTVGLTEADVCIGDVWRLGGSVLLQVSQARQPCFKLNHRFRCKDMALRVQRSGRTGWYYRVIEPGTVQAGDELRLVDRPCPSWPLSRLLHHLYVDTLDAAALAEIGTLAPLAESWRILAANRLKRGSVENWRRRLGLFGAAAAN